MTRDGEIDGYCDAAMGLVCQPANRFAAHHALRDDADWDAYARAYVEQFNKTSKERQ